MSIKPNKRYRLRNGAEVVVDCMRNYEVWGELFDGHFADRKNNFISWNKDGYFDRTGEKESGYDITEELE